MGPDRTAGLGWTGDFSLSRFRAKLANKNLMHPDLAPGYEEVYRIDLGERTISRKDVSFSGESVLDMCDSGGGAFLQRMKQGTLSSQQSLGRTLSRAGMSGSLADVGSQSLASLSAGSPLGLGRSSSVPSLGRMTRMEMLMEQEKKKPRGSERFRSSAPMSPEDKKEREKEMASDAASRKLWAAAHGAEMKISEYMEERKEDPTLSLKSFEVPANFGQWLKAGNKVGGVAKIDWRNDEPPWDGATLLIKAVRTNSFSLAEYCMVHGADPLIVDNNGRNLFHWAAKEGNPDMMKFFMDAVSDPPIQAHDNFGDTPLHLAAYYGHLPIIRLLIHAKVDPTLLNANGFNAADLAEARRMWHIGHYLSEQKHQEEDRENEDFQVRNLVRPCNLERANTMREITALNPPKAKAKPKAKGK